MKKKNKIIKIELDEDINRHKLEYMNDILLEFKGMATGMELETLAYLLEMSILETKLQIEISEYS